MSDDLVAWLYLVGAAGTGWVLWSHWRERRSRAAETEPAPPDERPPTVDRLSFDLDLRYTSLRGETLDRRVTVRAAWGEFGPRGGFVLNNRILAWCHLRQEVRTFHVLGMDRVIDPETGEVVTGLRRIEAWLSRRIRAEVESGRGRRTDRDGR